MSDHDASKGPHVTAEQVTLFDGRVVKTDELMGLLYDDLRHMAAGIFRAERPDQTLQPTALVNEAYLRLADQRSPWQNREHFFAVAARCMRRALVDQARARQTKKRGGEHQRVTLVDKSNGAELAQLDVLEIEEAMQQLAKVSPRMAQVTELRVFGGLGLDAVARVVDASRATVARDWAKARTLLVAYAQGL